MHSRKDFLLTDCASSKQYLDSLHRSYGTCVSFDNIVFGKCKYTCNNAAPIRSRFVCLCGSVASPSARRRAGRGAAAAARAARGDTPRPRLCSPAPKTQAAAGSRAAAPCARGVAASRRQSSRLAAAGRAGAAAAALSPLLAAPTYASPSV